METSASAGQKTNTYIEKETKIIFISFFFQVTINLKKHQQIEGLMRSKSKANENSILRYEQQEGNWVGLLITAFRPQHGREYYQRVLVGYRTLLASIKAANTQIAC